jgi:recombination protein RecT
VTAGKTAFYKQLKTTKMAQTETVPVRANPTKTFFQREDVKLKFKELLKDKAPQFITSVLSIINSSELLKNAVVESIYAGALKAAVLDLPIAPELGFSYLVPFKNHKTGITSANFQIGYKGLLQLALRSQQVKNISSAPVFEGQLITNNPLEGASFNWENKKSDKIVGYAAYMKLNNGFEKTVYMTDADVRKHAERFSKTFKTKGSAWDTDFSAMAQKTVLKQLISKYAPLSIDTLQQTIQEDDIFEGTDIEPVYDSVDHVDVTNEGVDKPALDDAPITHEDLTILFQMKRQALTPTEVSRAKNILDNKMQDSYLELATFLRAK